MSPDDERWVLVHNTATGHDHIVQEGTEWAVDLVLAAGEFHAVCTAYRLLRLTP